MSFPSDNPLAGKRIWSDEKLDLGARNEVPLYIGEGEDRIQIGIARVGEAHIAEIVLKPEFGGPEKSGEAYFFEDEKTHKVSWLKRRNDERYYG